MGIRRIDKFQALDCMAKPALQTRLGSKIPVFEIRSMHSLTQAVG
jgi:hypothetical protein